MKVLQVVGYKNAGKTTLVREIVGMLSSAGVRVGTLKHDAHDADPEPVGADTRGHREAGAFMTGMTSGARTSWVREQPTSLDDMLGCLRDAGAQAAIVEGFKTASYPKLVLLRGLEDEGLLRLPGIVAVAIRSPHAAVRQVEALNFPPEIPLFHTKDRQFRPLLEFIRDWWAL